ncbi:MAG: DinB family protein [Rhodospirillales bacterium]
MRTRLILALAAVPLWAQTLSQGEREFAMSSLHASRKMFLDAISGLSKAQWKFKPAQERWSIAEIAEHVVLADDLQRVQDMLKLPAAPRGTVDSKQDARMLERMADRSFQAKSPASMLPKGRWTTPEAVAAEFRQRHDRIIEYVETTRDPLRSHVAGSGENAYDAYQMILMLAGHVQRHVAQIEEVKADPKYPK